MRYLALAGVVGMLGVAIGGVSAAPVVITRDAPDLDRWMYPFNSSSVGTRPGASCFGALGQTELAGFTFDERDAQVLVGFDLSADVPADLCRYRITQATVRIAVTTDGAGGFAARLPKGPGRTVVAVYNGDRRYLGARSAPAKVNVKSKVTLKVPQTVDSDRGIVFAGKVKAKGAKLGRRGKRLEIQVLVGRRWKTVGRSIRTNGKGRFRLPYRFTADYPHAVDYRFRAAVLKERGFPYLPAKSKKRKVTVKP